MSKPTHLQRHASRPDDELCHWPGCGKPSHEWALCWKHSVKTYMMVKATVEAMQPDPPTVEPAYRRADLVGFVYFIRFRDRIKIGFSRNVGNRMRSVPHDELLAVMPGTMQDEKRCHAAFQHLREVGEWFRPEPDLMSFIESLPKSAA